MLDRAIALSRNPTLQRIGDVLLASAILLGSVADIYVHPQASGWGGPQALMLLSALLISVPLLWRKRYPIAVLVAVFVGGLLDVAAVAPHQAGFEPFVAEIVAFYSLGAHETERRSVAAYVLSVVVGLVPAAILNSTPGSVGAVLVWTFAAWLVGRIIRSWRSRAEALERANRELEQQRELQAEAAVAVERGRIARELHDVIAHSVSQMTVQAGAVRRLLLPEQERERETLESVEATGREALTEMRRLVGLLRERDEEADLAPQPSLSRLDALLGSMRERGLEVDVVVEGKARELPPGVDLSAYRLVQEALTSSIRAGSPGHAWVAVRWRDRELELEVGNDGLPDPAANGFARGLPGMRERVALVGGTLETGRRDGGGFVVRCHLPLESAA